MSSIVADEATHGMYPPASDIVGMQRCDSRRTPTSGDFLAGTRYVLRARCLRVRSVFVAASCKQRSTDTGLRAGSDGN